MYPGQW
jgi:hypothetical protein